MSDPDVLAELFVRRRAEERVQIRHVLNARPRLLDDRAKARRAGRDCAHDRVAHVAGAGLDGLGDGRDTGVPAGHPLLEGEVGVLLEGTQSGVAERAKRMAELLSAALRSDGPGAPAVSCGEMVNMTLQPLS